MLWILILLGAKRSSCRTSLQLHIHMKHVFAPQAAFGGEMTNSTEGRFMSLDLFHSNGFYYVLRFVLYQRQEIYWSRNFVCSIKDD